MIFVDPDKQLTDKNIAPLGLRPGLIRLRVLIGEMEGLPSMFILSTSFMLVL